MLARDLAHSLRLGAIGDSLTGRMTYTYSRFVFVNDPNFGNNDLPGAPRHFFRGEVRYDHGSGAWFAPAVEIVPDGYFVDSANTLKTDAYLLWGLRAVYDNGGPISGYIEARNLANTAYIASASIIDVANASSRLFNPGTGRAVFAGIRGKL